MYNRSSWSCRGLEIVLFKKGIIWKKYKDIIIELINYYKHNLNTDKKDINTFLEYIDIYKNKYEVEESVVQMYTGELISEEIVEFLFKLILVKK